MKNGSWYFYDKNGKKVTGCIRILRETDIILEKQVLRRLVSLRLEERNIVLILKEKCIKIVAIRIKVLPVIFSLMAPWQKDD